MLIMSARERDRAHFLTRSWAGQKTLRSWAHSDHKRDRERIYFLTIYPAFIVMLYFKVMLKSRPGFEAGPRHWSNLGLRGPVLNQAGPGPGWGLTGRPGLNLIENIWIIGFNQGIKDTLSTKLSHFYRFLKLLTTLRAIIDLI